MKRLLLLTLVSAGTGLQQVNAQQEVRFTHFTWNQFTFNPASAGAAGAARTTMVYHNQWAEFTGPDAEKAPITKTFSFDAPLLKRYAIGMHVVDDKEGFMGTTGIYGTMAYKIPLKFGADLSFGVNGGVIQKSLTPHWRPADASDPRLPGSTSSADFDGGAGVYLNAENYFIGLSALHIPSPNLSWSTMDFPVKRSYWLVSGYKQKDIAGGKIELQETILTQTDLTKTNFGLNVMATYNHKVYAAINYRSEDLTAISGMVGYYFTPGFVAGYSVDIPTKNSAIFGTTHEVMIQYTGLIGRICCPGGRILRGDGWWPKSVRWL
jgi:type IX secretion system PorP/SprF family membrane protein